MVSNGSAYWRTFDKKDDSIDQNALDALDAQDSQDTQDAQSSDKENMSFSLLMSSIIFIASVNNGWGTYNGCEEYLTDSGLPENIKTILLLLVAGGTSYATINFISSKNSIDLTSSCRSLCQYFCPLWQANSNNSEGKYDELTTNDEGATTAAAAQL